MKGSHLSFHQRRKIGSMQQGVQWLQIRTIKCFWITTPGMTMVLHCGQNCSSHCQAKRRKRISWLSEGVSLLRGLKGGPSWFRGMFLWVFLCWLMFLRPAYWKSCIFALWFLSILSADLFCHILCIAVSLSWYLAIRPVLWEIWSEGEEGF